MEEVRLDVIGNQRLGQLKGTPYLAIQSILNTENCWRSFVATLAQDENYTLSTQEVSRIENNSNPAYQLFLKLCSQNMTIQEFVYYAGQAQIHSILNVFHVTVPPRIVQEPFSTWNITAGESLSLEVRCTGSPPLSYRWFKDNIPIPDTNRNVLLIRSTRVGDSGVYHCHVWNDVNQNSSVQTRLIRVIVSRAKPIVISEHPRSFTISSNGIAVLRCQIWGDSQVDYQWMRNKKEIMDNPGVTVGSNTNELKLYNVQSRDSTGIYCCRISRGEEVLFTEDAIVQVTHTDDISYTATDKVALLMGAEDYRSEHRLPGSRNDVKAMAEVFRSLDFKVVSLLNLPKEEMMAAIHKFKEMIGDGVYCVFYFVGHGFEAAGQCFLVPPDAPQGYDHTHCLSAEHILFNILLQQNPKLCVMILDICRLRREGDTIPQMLNSPVSQYFVCYGTSPGLPAYEKNKSGILVNHLKYILNEPIGIEEVFTRLREELRTDPVLREKEAEGKGQVPEVRANLSQTKRSFHDRIDAVGYTQEVIERQRRWEMWQPGLQDLQLSFPGFNVLIKLEFHAEFSNEMTVFTSVISAGQAKICRAHISEISAEVADNAQVYIIEEGTETSLCKNYLTLHNLQSLKTELQIIVTVTCILHDNRIEERSETLLFRPPLASSLCLYESLETEEIDNGEFVGIHV